MKKTKDSNKKITITPEGFTESIVLELGDWKCGREEHGIGIYITQNRKWDYGGVLTREDMQKLITTFSKHLEKFPLSIRT